MKKILFGTIVILSMLAIIGPFASAGEPPPCSTWTLIGPPLVGTWVVSVVSQDAGLYTLSFNFSGCCADCFEKPLISNRVSIEWTDTLNVLPEQFLRDEFQDYVIRGIQSKRCNPIVNGVELQDVVVDTILTFDNYDVNGDAVNDLVSQVVMYYYVCNN